ncbi:Olfactory receptor 51T1 [Myotis davidii]|uniref:Olfactory receptor 51T1 n=1 Tax=Myotis davidii TaxID=225400 RepID=L5LXY5_MYODS|nr:Olfactory receptor 51T1 [Myotis davidii]
MKVEEKKSAKKTFWKLFCSQLLPGAGANVMVDEQTAEAGGKPASFLMIGIPGLEAAHGWISIPFSCMYTAALTGNCLILLAVRRTPSLHQPMYYFLSMLALTDVGLTLSTMPTTLAVLWFDHRLIAFNACLVQMFFLHSFSVVESSVLLAMSFDRGAHPGPQHLLKRSHLSGDLFCLPRMLSAQSYVNISFFQPASFLMIGIPGLEAAHGWISIPFSCMYTVALTGNCLILLAVRRTPSLHQPMYYFLSMLALTA